MNPEAQAVKELEIAALLNGILKFIGRYVVMPGEAELSALALFVAHSYAIEGAHATPYLLVTSPERQSGKTRVLEVIEHLVRRPWRIASASEAAMFRKIERDRPTLLLDEIDAIFGSHAERTEPQRGILNAGNRPGSCVSRCVGEKSEVQDFSVYCAKVLAGIDSGHRIPDTVRDRSIPIRMQRKTGAEQVERFRPRFAKAEAQGLREDLKGWGEAVQETLLEANPDIPEELSDRAAEGWEALFTIADQAGPEWAKKARAAAVVLNGPQESDEQTNGALVLGAIREVMGERDRVQSAELLESINANEELPFGGWREGKGLDGRILAKLLKPYGVKPDVHDFAGEKARGYLREDLAEAWERWLPGYERNQRNCVTDEAGAGDELPLSQGEVTPVTQVTPPAGEGVVPFATSEEEEEIARLEAKLGEAA